VYVICIKPISVKMHLKVLHKPKPFSKSVTYIFVLPNTYTTQMNGLMIMCFELFHKLDLDYTVYQI